VADSTLIHIELTVAQLNRSLVGYRVVREIGHGSMGVVYEAHQESVGRRVAIKVLPPNMALRDRTVKRFLREAEAMGRLSHHNIVDIHEVGSVGTLHYFSMQYVEGPPLDSVLKAGPLAIADVLDIGFEVATALAHAHARGVLHRDVKPSNLLRDGERVVLTDFGLARPIDHEEAGSMTESGDLVGTPLYMSPEQISGEGERTDARSDVWGLGATLYELLTQRPPFLGTRRAGDPELDPAPRSAAPAQAARRHTGDLEAVVLSASRRIVGRRYATAAASLEDLRRISDGRPVSRAHAAVLRPALRWMRRNPVEAGVLGASMLVVVTIAVILWLYVYPEFLKRTFEAENAIAATKTAEAATKTAQRERELKKIDFVKWSARSVMSESSRLWQEGRAEGNEDQCREAEERIFDLMRTRRARPTSRAVRRRAAARRVVGARPRPAAGDGAERARELDRRRRSAARAAQTARRS
jgi:predicted Ser/Thr protein kinase